MNVLLRLLLTHVTARLLIRSTQSKALEQDPTNNAEISVQKVVTIKDKNLNKITRLM